MKDKIRFGLLLGIIAIVLAIIVNAVAPTWDFSAGNFNLQEDSGTTSYDLRNFATDPESDPLTFTLNSQSNTSVINCALGADGFTLNCTTVANQSGTSDVQVTANDTEVPSNAASGTFTLTVAAVNDAPVIVTAPSNKEAVEGVLFSHTLPTTSVSDVDNVVADLRVEPTSLPAWLAVDQQNGLKFSGTPASTDVGTQMVNLRITDGQDVSEAAPFNLTVKPALEILEDSVQIIINDGESVFAFTDDDDDVNVSPGDKITWQFDYTNNYNKPLYNIKMELVRVNEDGSETPLVPLTSSRWKLSTGTVGSDDVEAALPLTVTEESYTLKLKVRGNSFTTLFEDSLEKTFEVVREEASAEITKAELSNSLACTRSATLNIEITNTGENTISPEILVYKDEQTNFDEATGTFEDEELARVPFASLQPGTSPPEEEIALSFTPPEWTEGEHTLFVYLVDPNAEDPVIHSQEVDFTIGNCLVPTPAEGEFHLRVNEKKEFRAAPTELSGFKQFIRWFINDEQQRNKNGQISLGQRTFPAGENVVKAAIVQGGVTIDEVSWVVTVSNRPLTDNFNLPGFDESKPLASYTGFTVENAAGSITFDQAVDLANIFTLDDIMVVARNGNLDIISVDTAAAPGLAGRSATITLPHAFTNPLILKADGFVDEQNLDFAECAAPACTVVQNTAGEFVFQVDSFSTYLVLEEVPAALSVLPAEITFDNVVAGQNVNTTITIMNTGSFDALTGLTAQLLNVSTAFNAQLSGLSSSTLNPGASVTPPLTLSLTIPAGEPAGKHQVGTLRVTSSAGTKDVPVFINPKSFLTVKSVKINGKSDGKFQLDEATTVKVEVKNDHTQDMEDVQVTVTLKDINDDELEEESELFDLREGKDDEVELTFDLRNEDVENEQFTMEIVVEGEDESGNVHRTVDIRTVQLDLENHNVIVKSAALETASLSCQRQTLLRVTVQNIGKSDEDDVEVRVRNSALGLNMVKLGIDLDDFASEDNEYQALGTVNAEDAPAGLYPITVEVYRDGKLEDTEEVSLEVKACGQPTAGTGAGTVQPPAGEQKKEVVIDVASQKLAEELQKQLAARKAALEQPQPATISSFRESGMYLPLLGVFVALVFLAVVLGLVVLVTRK